jgi:hypothetical protein
MQNKQNDIKKFSMSEKKLELHFLWNDWKVMADTREEVLLT